MEYRVEFKDKSKICKWTGLGLVLGAIILMGLGIFLKNKNDQNVQYYANTTAIIQKFETEWNSSRECFEAKPYVTYTVNGVTYENIKLNFYNNFMQIGDEVEIFYDTRDPSVLVSAPKITNIVTTCFFIASPIMLVVSIILFVVAKRESY